MDALERINQGISKKGFNFTVTYSDLGQEFKEIRQSDGVKLSYKLKQIENGEFLCLFNAWNVGDQKVHAVFSNSKPDPNTKRRIAKEKKNTQALIAAEQLKIADSLPSQIEEWKRTNNFALSPYAREKHIDQIRLGDLDVCFTKADGTLAIPMRDKDFKIWSIQSIYLDKDQKFQKRFLKGGRTKALAAVLPGETFPIYITEGFATGSAVWEALGRKHPVAVSFSKNNLEATLNRYEKHLSILVCDWDGATFKKTGENPGLAECLRLSKKYNVPVAVEPAGEKNYDFSDIWLDDPLLAQRSLLNPLVGEGLTGMEEFAKRNDEKKLEVVTQSVAVVPEIVADSFNESAYPSAVDGFHTFVQPDKGKGKWEPQYYQFAKYCRQKFHLKSIDGVTYGYANNYYEAWSPLKIKKLTMDLLRENTAPGVIRGMAEMVQTESFVEPETLKAPPGKMNLANGVFDVRSKRLEAHTPDYFFKYLLPHDYIPDAHCPSWLFFLDQTFEGNRELIDLSAEVFGWVIVGGSPLIHTSVFLQGEGRNGKGVFLDTLKAMIGQSNYSAVPLNMLEKPFSAVQADGKLANIVTEVSTQMIQSDVFKTAVSGEEVVGAYKGRDEFKFPFHARIIMAANKTPFMGDTTTGTHEKFLILPFNRYLQKHEREMNFVGKRILPEMSGILNWALDGLDRLMRRGYFLESKAVETAVEDMRREIDNVYQWFCEHVRLGAGASVRNLTFGDFYSDYVFWAERQNLNPVSKIVFAKKCNAEVRKHPNFEWTRPQNIVTLRGPIKIQGKQ